MNAPVGIATLKLVKVGNSTGIVLPRQVLAKLGVEAGDTLKLSIDAEGSLRLERSDDDFEAQMAAARNVMARRKRALRELAK